MFFIYVIQNILDLKIYVGQTNDPPIRWNRHKSMSRSNSKQFIHRAMRLHKIENFTFQVIEEWETEQETNEAEEFWIEFFQSKNQEFGYNLTNGGEGSRGLKHSDSSIKKMSQTRQKIFEDPTARQKQSEAAKNHYLENPDTAQKISDSLKNHFKNPEAIKANSEALNKYYENNPDAGRKISSGKKKKYSSEIITEVKSLHNSGWKNIDIADKFGMPVVYVSGIITGKKRKHG